MSDVFVSYAREDAAFVKKLGEALHSRGRDVWVDVEGIEPADRWKLSANEAIERSDTFAFVLSRASLASGPCLAELEYAEAQSKRVIAICIEEAVNDLDKPHVLEDLSWIMMRPEDDFDAGVGRLIHALDTDLEVARTHTRILVRAKAWELADRRASPLLRGDELGGAEDWLSRAAGGSGPQPTELQREFIRASRRAATRRQRIGLGAATVVAAIAIGLSIFALIERSQAVRQATLATSRQLAAVSESELSSNLDVALLLAVRAFRTDPNPQTRSALLLADLSSPRLVRFVQTAGAVATLAGSSDRSTVVAGLTDGRVIRLVGGKPTAAIASLGSSVKSVAVSGDGHAVAAASETRATLWRAGAGAIGVPCTAAGETPNAVGLSPSGLTALVHCEAAPYEGPESIEVVDVPSGSVTAVHGLPGNGFHPSVLVFVSDARVLMFDAGGPWQLRRIPSWSLERFSHGTFGAHQGVAGYSNDGRFLTVTNDAPTIPVWPATSPTAFDPEGAPLTGDAPISSATALTLSPEATELAVADSGTIYIAPIAKRTAAHASSSLLAGGGSINADVLRFFGDGRHLLSASGNTIALWDLSQIDRLTHAYPTALEPPCNGCLGAQAAISPDGRKIAVVAGDGGSAATQPLDDTRSPEVVDGYHLGPPVWDGGTALFPLLEPAHVTGLPGGVRVLPAAYPGEEIAADALTDRGHTFTFIGGKGDVYVQDSNTGKVERHTAGQTDSSGDEAPGLGAGMAAIEPERGLVAIVDNGVVRIGDTRAPTRKALPGSDALFVAFSGDRLLVQRNDGSLEIWSALGSERQRVLPGDASYAPFYPVADTHGDLVARQRSDGSVALVDLNSGATVGAFPAPVSTALGIKLGLTFSPSSEKFVTVVQTIVGTTPEILERDISDQSLVRTACATAGRNLTAAEWRTFVGTSPAGSLSCR